LELTCEGTLAIYFWGNIASRSLEPSLDLTLFAHRDTKTVLGFENRPARFGKRDSA